MTTAVAARLHARPTGEGQWLARCPAHADRTPSLAIRDGEGGRVLVRCWAGCDTAAGGRRRRERKIECDLILSPTSLRG